MFSANSLAWLEQVLEERYGLPVRLVAEGQSISLQLPDAEGCIHFDTLRPEFHRSDSNFSCGKWDASREGFKSVMGSPLPAPAMATGPERVVEARGPKDVYVHYDILGLTYWMLSRLEEVSRHDLDQHGRFPATSSHAYKHGYLERPVVDEWLDILGQLIKMQWPLANLRRHEFGIRLSHDVDSPSLYGFKSWTKLARMMGGDLVKRRNPKAFVTAPYVRLMTRKRLHRADPHNTFAWLMELSEANGLSSAFYFICGQTNKARDADYDLGHPAIRELLREIHARGHEIGLHPSYDTYQKPELISKEADRLRRVCDEEGIEQDQWGGRMHFLRWEQPKTLRAWAAAGMDYDSTLGYADRPGFRSGTCFEYPAYDPVAQEALSLTLRPLVVMECTVIDEKYMGLGYTSSTVRTFTRLQDTCRKVRGQFSILWHNSYLTRLDAKLLLNQLVQADSIS